MEPDLSYLDRCLRLQVKFCQCGGILPDCEYGQHQQALKWSAGLCKCKPKELPEVEQLKLL